MHSHLVTIEVGVERRTHHRVQTNRLAFHEHRFKRLNRQTVQRRRTVQEDGFILRHFFKNIPDLFVVALNHLTRRTNRVANAKVFQTANDERLEQTKRHLLRNAALRELEFRPNDNHRTARIVHTLTQQVLTEAARLALQNLGQRLERTIARPHNRTAMTTVIKHRIHRLLQHALLVADNHIRRLEREQISQTVVTVDDAAIKVIQIARRKLAAFQRNERTKLWRNHRQHVENHPFRLRLRRTEPFNHLHALGDFLAVLLGARVLHFLFEVRHQFIKVDLAKKLTHSLRAHLRLEAIIVLFLRVRVFRVRQNLAFLERRVARLNNHPVLIIKDAFKLVRRLIEQQAHARRRALEEPNVAHWHRKFNVAHALTAHRSKRHFYTATVANNAFVLNLLELAACAFPVLRRTENLFAEQTFLLRTVRAIVNRFRILDLTVRPTTDRLRRSELNLDRIIMGGRIERTTKDVGRIIRMH